MSQSQLFNDSSSTFLVIYEHNVQAGSLNEQYHGRQSKL